MTVIGYTDLALEGANVTFTCSSGLSDLLPTEPTVSTCMSNGQWSPDPREIECKGINFIVNSSSKYFVFDFQEFHDSKLLCSSCKFQH